MIAGPPGGVKPEAGPLFTASLLQTSFQFSLEPYGCAHNSRTTVILYQASQVALGVKNPPANAEDIRDVSSIPGLGRSLEEGMATLSSVLAWRIPWPEEPGGLQSIGSHRIRSN